MKQRLGIAGALLGSPSILMLDEPTIALDEDGIDILYTILRDLKAEGQTILLASHEKEIIDDLADMTVRMQKGRVIEVIERS